MDWSDLIATKALDWLWAIFLATLAYVWRLEAEMHRHRTHLELLQAEMKNRVENASSLQSGIDRVAVLVEAHRVESAERMGDLRNELREDIKLLVGAIRQGPT